MKTAFLYLNLNNALNYVTVQEGVERNWIIFFTKVG